MFQDKARLHTMVGLGLALFVAVIIFPIIIRTDEIRRQMVNADRILLYSSNLEGDWTPGQGVTAISLSPAVFPGAIYWIPKGSELIVLDCETYDGEPLGLSEVAWEKRGEIISRCRSTDFRMYIRR